MNPFVRNQREQLGGNEPPYGFQTLNVPHRVPQLHLPKSFNSNASNDIWPGLAAFFDLYFPHWLLQEICDNKNEYRQLLETDHWCS